VPVLGLENRADVRRETAGVTHHVLPIVDAKPRVGVFSGLTVGRSRMGALGRDGGRHGLRT